MKKTVTIGIAAYNSEKNIKRLLKSLIDQREKNFTLEKILVHSDFSTDQTIKKTREIMNKKIIVIEARKRMGFVGSVETLLNTNTSDILILLNDDVLINDSSFIEKCIEPFSDGMVGLSSVKLIPTQPSTFVEKAVASGYMAYANFARNHRDGNNILTCDGKVLIVSNDFAKKFSFPKTVDEAGNLDTYFYAECLDKKFKYSFAKNAYVLFRCPATIADFTKWQKRNYRNRAMIQNHFTSIKNEYALPKLQFNYYKLLELIKNPIGSIFILFLGIYCSLSIKSDDTKFDATWDLVKSTKEISKTS